MSSISELTKMAFLNEAMFRDAVRIGAQPNSPRTLHLSRSVDDDVEHEPVVDTLIVICSYEEQAVSRALPWYDMNTHRLMRAAQDGSAWEVCAELRDMFSYEVPTGGGGGGGTTLPEAGGSVIVEGTGGLSIPSGTTDQRPTQQASIRYNSELGRFEGLTPEGWVLFSEDDFDYEQFSVEARSAVLPTASAAVLTDYRGDALTQVLAFGTDQRGGFNYTFDAKTKMYTTIVYQADAPTNVDIIGRRAGTADTFAVVGSMLIPAAGDLTKATIECDVAGLSGTYVILLRASNIKVAEFTNSLY